MADSKESELRALLGQHDKVVYEAVKDGIVDDLPPEHQSLARAMAEHRHLRHIHHALEFADLREGEAYEIEVDGNVVSPMAHLAMHAAAKGQIDADPPVRAAFEKMVASGASPHHAEHVLAALFAELYFNLSKAAEAGTDPEKARAAYYRKIKKLTRDAFLRRKLLRQISAGHEAFE